MSIRIEVLGNVGKVIPRDKKVGRSGVTEYRDRTGKIDRSCCGTASGGRSGERVGARTPNGAKTVFPIPSRVLNDVWGRISRSNPGGEGLISGDGSAKRNRTRSRSGGCFLYALSKKR